VSADPGFAAPEEGRKKSGSLRTEGTRRHVQRGRAQRHWNRRIGCQLPHERSGRGGMQNAERRECSRPARGERLAIARDRFEDRSGARSQRLPFGDGHRPVRSEQALHA
jgi:hypothetical protein